MFGTHFAESSRVRLHRFLLLVLSIFVHAMMFLKNSQSFKWIRKRFGFRAHPSHGPDNRPAAHRNRTLDAGDVTKKEGTTAETTPTSDDGKRLHEVLVVTNGSSSSSAIALGNSNEAVTEANGGAAPTIDHNNSFANLVNEPHICAPIAREEDAEESDVNQNEIGCVSHCEEDSVPVPTPSAPTASSSSSTATVRRSKSRVRTYLRRCRDRLTGQQHPSVAPQTEEDANPNVAVVNAVPLAVVEEGTEPRASSEADRLSVVTAAEEDDHGSYEDIDFGLASVESGASGDDGADLLAEIDAHQAERRRELQELQLRRSKEEQMESGLAALIDAHLGPVYPVYQERTRAVLLREARALLVAEYGGSLQTFERQFLASAAQIASELRRKHAIGESLVWCRGWPLATPVGEVILHLGALDEALVRPADIYLCIKAVDKSTPKLHAVWRSAPSSDGATTLRSRCIDHRDPKAYLSILELEMMLSDELPQLLQSLLVGVERAIGRVSIGELTASRDSNHHGNHNVNNNNINNNKNNTSTTSLASPKCGLRRSELITKNKMLNNKFMLRRLTNRQDSMTSTSSGNSCSSSGSSTGSGSSSNDELIGGGGGVSLSMMTSSTSANSLALNRSAAGGTAGGGSPALPLFCLGNSFPHIDSDEENADEKRNSLDCDTSLSEEIIPPHSICEIPEKLLTSGIYLPGTRDLKGHPILTVDADCLMSSGLNCYEVATVMLYYNTITESIGDFNCNQQLQLPAKQHQQQLEHKHDHEENVVAVAAVSQQPATQTFTILITIERANHLSAVDLICQSLKLIVRHIEFCEILAVCLDRSLLQLAKQRTTAQPPQSRGQEVGNKQQPMPTKEMEQKEQPPQQQQQLSSHSVKFISVDEVTTSVAAPSQVPAGRLCGLHNHEPRKWREFFGLIEPFQSQCVATGQRLVTAMNEIRCSDMQSTTLTTMASAAATTRRQLYAQHRALSRALMDSELHNVRKRGLQTLARLQDLARAINGPAHSFSNNNISSSSNHYTNNHIGYSYVNRNSISTTATTATALRPTTTTAVVTSYSTSSAATAAARGGNPLNNNNIDVAIRLQKVTLLFNEVDRAAKRLEQLTEQRRERLREVTRQRALEDEINEVTSWITSDGNETLQRFSSLQLDGETTTFKEHEQEFEKYYFISMKHLAKGRDLHQAAVHMDALHESAAHLKGALDCFAVKLEQARERIEGASRLHQLLTSGRASNDDEVQRLAEKIGVTPGLLEKWRQHEMAMAMAQEGGADSTAAATPPEPRSRTKPNSLNLSLNLNQKQSRPTATGASSTPTPTPTQTKPNTMFTSTPLPKQPLTKVGSGGSSTGGSEGEGVGSGSSGQGCHCWRESRHVEDVDAMLDEDGDPGEEDEREKREAEEEEQSKIADSGLGGCDRCEGNPKLSRICSCQSLNEAGNLYEKGHNSDDLDDECFEQPSKRFLNIHSPMEANAHLQCHASSLDLPKMEELSCLEPKIQKTLLLIMREMIGTERDYVRSLYYVIDNYVDELLRDDIPQPLRGQRNVIFGNIEKIFEFHNSHFLRELERYEHNPLKVGAAFIEMESKFYLYALYNKNKPKSDTLLSEYGTTFFKSKQLELNDKMDLASYLLKPVQRMGKYALLLQQLVKACSSVQGSALQEIAADVEELQRAEEMVKFQLRHGNDLLAMDSLRDCDVNVKEQGRLMRQNEFLVWQGRGGKKSLRQVFLFEELVLFSKARRFPDHKNLDIYIYKNSIKTSDIGLTAHVGDSPTKFEIWFRKRKPEDTWTLQCMSEDIKNAWTEEISKLLWKQAKRNRDIRLAEMSSMGIGSKPCLDIRPSHNQISDRSITISQLGKAPKLRHSFVGLHPESGKSSKRPNSLISESSISSGTSSSSTSTGSSSGSGGGGGKNVTNYSGHQHNHHGLELINETQTLMLAAGESGGGKNNSHGHSHSNSNTNTLSSTSSSGASGNLRNNKRSTTLVSQLSMESGILSDMSMTPDQEQLPESAAMTWSTATVVMRRKCGNTIATAAAMNARNSEPEQHLSRDDDEPGLEERIANVKV